MLLRRTFKPDRRRRSRQLLNTSVRVFTKSGSLEALGINISDHGMCLFTLANLPINSQIQLEFLPPRSEDPIHMFGKVRHRALYLYGIEFLPGPGQPTTPWEDVASNADRPDSQFREIKTHPEHPALK
jgi:PilZ domain